MLKEYVFDTGVKPFSFDPPAAMASLPGYRDSGNGVYVVPFTCEEVPEEYKFEFASDFPDIKPNENYIVREIVGKTALLSKYAYFIKIVS